MAWDRINGVRYLVERALREFDGDFDILFYLLSGTYAISSGLMRSFFGMAQVVIQSIVSDLSLRLGPDLVFCDNLND